MSDEPGFWKKYRELNSKKIPSSSKLNDLTYVVVDTETTGLDPGKDKIISFAGLRISKMRIIIRDSLELMINPGNYLTDKSKHIHEITDSEKNRGIKEEDAIEKIIEFIGSDILTGVNINFDLTLLKGMLRNYVPGRILNRSIDISLLARRLEKPPYKTYHNEKLDLESLCSRYQIPLEGHHTAPGDTFSMSMLFLKLMSAINKRGIRTWKELR